MKQFWLDAVELRQVRGIDKKLKSKILISAMI
jgi:hypothetical protein